MLEFNFVFLQAVQEKNISIDFVWFINLVFMFNQFNLFVVWVCNFIEVVVENVCLFICYEGENKLVGILIVFVEFFVVDIVNIFIQWIGWYEVCFNIIDFFIQFDDNYYIVFNVKE